MHSARTSHRRRMNGRATMRSLYADSFPFLGPISSLAFCPCRSTFRESPDRPAQGSLRRRAMRRRGSARTWNCRPSALGRPAVWNKPHPKPTAMQWPPPAAVPRRIGPITKRSFDIWISLQCFRCPPGLPDTDSKTVRCDSMANGLNLPLLAGYFFIARQSPKFQRRCQSMPGTLRG